LQYNPSTHPMRDGQAGENRFARLIFWEKQVFFRETI
jgi:hypothetical protein